MVLPSNGGYEANIYQKQTQNREEWRKTVNEFKDRLK